MERKIIVEAMLLLLLMIPSSVAVTIIWHVKPDHNTNHFMCPPNTTCYTLSETLQQYSKVQPSSVNNTLHFQPGIYNLHDDYIVSTNLSMFQLQGEASKSTPIIKCYPKSHSLTFQNVHTIVINNINFEDCGSVSISTRNHSRYIPATLHFAGCYDTSIHNITITPSANSSGIITVDCHGLFTLTNYTIIMEHCNNEKHTVTQYGIFLNFTGNFIPQNDAHYHLTLIQYYYELNEIDCCNYAVGISHLQRYTARVSITIKQLNVSDLINPRVLYYHSNACSSSSYNQLLITNSLFNNNRELKSTMFNVTFEDCWLKESCMSQESHIQFSQCHIIGNTWSTVKPFITVTSIFSVYIKSQLFISNCSFNENKNMLILKVKSKNDLTWLYTNSITIADTNIAHTVNNKKVLTMIYTQHTLLSTNRLTVRNIKNVHSIIRLNNSVVQMQSLNILAYNKPQYLVRLNAGSYICIMDNSDCRIQNNNVRSMFYFDEHGNKRYPCIMQFISRKGRLDRGFGLASRYLYNITITNNEETQSMFPKRELFNTSNCEVIPGTAFDQYSYAALAETFVMENNTNKKIHDICNCDTNGKPECEGDVLVATYPGKTVTTKFVVSNHHNNSYTDAITLIVDESQSNCTVLNKSEIYQHQPNYNCSEFLYTLSSLSNKNCSLYLRETTLDVIDKFWVYLQPCPLGFSFNTDSITCQCDQVLKQYSLPITSCNINNEMVSRQANSWVSGEARDKYQISNYAYIYKASSSCPFDFCQEYTSQLLLNESDVQCQYNRTGVACGHCPVNLSTIFGSSRCQKCSNIHLLIIIPIAASGVLLVLLMFALNLTIVNGSIATFILYVNIVSINKVLLFPTHLSSTVPVYVIIAMANLDLGIELCFYDGMDDYAKMWLQLLFPFYLMFIAALLIVASRHFRIVQRVTAQRGLPVLATLFLLSYTKILSTACTVLLLYTKVVTLSRNAQGSVLDHRVELVWSVSTNIALFEGKHIILFIVNILLLLILIPFNIILLFNRKLSRFRIIQRFKPILDPYKAPYKDKFYYWAGYQLVIRMAYLSAAGLNKTDNLTVAILITGFVMCIHGYLHPFKHKLLNLQELMMMLNILIIYVSTNFEQDYYQIIIRAVVGAAMIYFTMMLLWHSMTQTCSKCLTNNLPHKIIKWKDKLSDSYELGKMPVQDNTWVIGTYEEYREPLVAVTD